MPNGEIAQKQIREQYAEAIKDIERDSESANCQSHASLARGVVLMMRRDLLEMDYAQDIRAQVRAAVIRTLVGGLITGALAGGVVAKVFGG